MGGEPFIHQKLVRKILRDFGTNPKVGRYVIVTNGTIMPDQETIDVMVELKERCEINFSHYGDLSRKESEVIALLEKFGINYDISSPRVWYKQGELKDYNRTDKENQQLFFECNVRLGCSMLNEGELHICTRSSTGARMGKIPKTAGEYVDCYNQNDIAVLRSEISAPVNAVNYCLNAGGIKAEDLDYAVFYDNSLLTLDRYMKNVLSLGDKSCDLINHSHKKMFSQKLWVHEHLKKIIPTLGDKTKFLMLKHHISHAASAFYPSPFEKSVILTVDGVGEWTTLAIGVGDANKI